MDTLTNPILEELWRIKDELAREAGDDVRRLCDNTRLWAAGHPQRGSQVKDATELRAYLASKEEAELCVVREDPPNYGNAERLVP